MTATSTTLVFLNDPLSPVAIVLFALALAALGIYGFRTVSIAGVRRALGLIGLRTLAVVMLSLVLLQPAVLSWEQATVRLPESFTRKDVHIPGQDVLRTMLPPLSAFKPPRRESRNDVRIVQVVPPPVAFLKSECTVTLGVYNDAAPQDGEIVVRRLDPTGPVEITRHDVALGPGRKTVPVSLVPGRPGKLAYEVTLERFGRDEIPENNRALFSLTVARDSVRILHIAGHPSWDTRFLRQLLKSLPSTDLISFYLLVEAEDFAPHSREELALIPFPTNELFIEEIGNFDLIIAQNFPLGTYFLLKEKHMARLSQFVHEGGALFMLGGDRSYTLSRLQDTALAPALPVDLEIPIDSPEYVEGPLTLDLTPEGRYHPIFAREATDADSDPPPFLPPLKGANVMGAARPGAAVLARAGTGADSLPLIVAGTHGRGRMLLTATDSLWRWAFSGEGPAQAGDLYRQFFLNAISWLTRDPRMEGLKLIQESPHVFEGQENHARACFRGKLDKPVSVAVLAQWLDPVAGKSAMKVELASTTEEGCASFVLPPARPGAWQVFARIDSQEMEASGSEVFVVEPALPSYTQRLAAQVDPWLSMRFFPFVLDPVFTVELEQSTVTLQRPVLSSLWNHPALFVLLVLVILAEWGLRKRWGYF